MDDGFHVDLAALKGAAEGINGVLDQVSRRKVSDIDCAPEAVGHGRLSEVVADFCDRWSIGVENLAKDAQEVSGRLTECVKSYEEVDRGALDRFDQILRSSSDPAAPR